jgi:hypothetical protein
VALVEWRLLQATSGEHEHPQVVSGRCAAQGR